jgi:Zn-dependent peptidase ImmA (M78 family)
MAQTDFQTHLAALLKCDEREDLPDAAARFILGISSAHLTGDQCRGYLFIDTLLEEAQGRFSIELKHVNAGQSSHLGRLYTRPGGFILKIRKDMRPATYRFVKAHEFAHLLAYDRTWQEPRRSFPNSPSEEKLCDRIARHVLLPAELLNSSLDGLVSSPEGFDVSRVEALSKEFLVAPWQLVRRAIEKDKNRADVTVAILWKRETNDTLRITDCLSPSGLYIPLRDRCFRDSEINQAPWKAVEVDKAISDEGNIRFGSLSGKLLSIAFPTSSPWPSVIQIVYLDPVHVEKLSHWRAAHGQAYH